MARITNLITADGLTVYDLDPRAAELTAVAGPAGYDDVSTITPDEALPFGFRWVTDAEWERLNNPPEELAG